MFDLPIEPIMTAQPMYTISGQAYRIVITLCVAYWTGGCRPLPEDDIGLAILARIPSVHFVPHSVVIRDALSEILPKLQVAHKQRFALYEKNAAHALHMTTVRRARKRQEQMSTVSTSAALPQREQRIAPELKTRPIAVHGDPPAQARGHGPFRGKGFTD